jgi:Pectinacetylesterase
MARRLHSATLLLALMAPACASDDEPSDVPFGPKLADLPQGWSAIAPGGDTICARGTPYQFFVRPGSVNRLIIDFRGGGACWNAATCGLGEKLFQETADADRFVADDSQAAGIYDKNNAENPVKDWHHVYLPYCTGDVHWGDATRTYGEGDAAFTIEHKGAVNVRAVLSWVYANWPAPEKILVTGCSAGAYGAIMWSAHVRNHYPSSKVYELADSGAGVITQSFFQESFPQWNAQASYPLFIQGVDPNLFTRLPQLYELIGTTFPDMIVSQYNTRYDENQTFYFQAMGGGDAVAWSEQMIANVAEIEQTTPNFSAYIAPDFKHCIIPYPEFYSVESGGKRLVDWLSDMVSDRALESVDCEPACGAPKPAP